MNHILTLSLAAAIVPGLIGCERFDKPETEIDCDHGAGDRVRITGSVQAWRSVVDGRAVVHVEGTAEHEDGLAIQRIEVARVSADPDEGSFNFSGWAVDLEFASVRSLQADPETGEVLLSVLAFDACDKSYDLGTVGVALRDPPAVDSLTVVIDYPDGEDHLPSTLSIPAAVTVTATGNPGGVPVSLTTERGEFLGGGDDPAAIDLRLAPAAEGEAMASTFVVAQGADTGEALVTATALESAATTRIRVAGPPRLTPPGGDLLFGGIQPVDVSTDGRLVSCESDPPDGVDISYAGQTLGGVVAIDDLDGHRATLLIAVDPDTLGAQSAFVVTCRDAYGQASSGTFNTPEPPLPPAQADGGEEGEGEFE